MLIREIKLEDAEGFVSLVKEVEEDADFMMMEAGERRISAEQQRKRIEQMKSGGNSTILLAEGENGKLVGYLIVVGGDAKRVLHRGYLVIGILKEFRGQGIGTKLFSHLDKWAKEHYISRLELTVVTQNKMAVALYKKSGFEIEGIKRNSLLIDNVFYDEYYMAKLI